MQRDQADLWFSKAVRLAADYVCANCHMDYSHEPGMCQNCHVHSRKFRSIRWDTQNAICMCAKCHAYYTDHPIYWGEFVAKYFGAGHEEILLEKKNQIFKATKEIRREIAAHYRQEFRRMTETGDRNLISY